MAAVEDNQQQEEERETEQNTHTTMATTTTTASPVNYDKKNGVILASMSRKEKRKAMKKMKRKQLRKEIAIMEKREEEARLNDPEEQMKLLKLEQEEAEQMLRDRLKFEERERQFLQDLELKKKQEEHQKLIEQESQNNLVNNENANEANEDDGWEYIEEGPAEIIWKGNEIIVKKKTIRVLKKAPDVLTEKQESERPISNPLAPQSEACEDYKSAQEVLESVAQQVPNFGTEQDKAHCPFHLKTGVCRFGIRCSRVHFYPDKACTILIKNMYNGPGLAWEQDEGLEHTDEEVQRSFEDFYEDVHTEFLKFGEIVNFKVCKNGSSHLRGNVYVHYKSLESATIAYQSVNGRYFAGKLLTCEFVSLTRWRIAICGEHMKSRLKTCSRGSACNFIHCFRNPGGDYEWADWDKPAPRYWLKKMAALFGYTSNGYTDGVSPRYHSRRSRSRGLESPHRKNFSDEDDGHKRKHFRGHRSDDRDASKLDDEIKEGKSTYRDSRSIKHRETFNDHLTEGSTDGHGTRKSSKRRRESESTTQDSKHRKLKSMSAKDELTEGRASDRYMEYKSRSSRRQKRVADSVHDRHKGDNPYADKDHDTLHRPIVERCSQRNKEADSSISDSYGDSVDSEVDGHHRHRRKKLRKIKNEVEESSSASDERRHVRIEKREQNNRKEHSRLKNTTNVSEIKCSGDDSYGNRQHRGVEKSSKEMKRTSGSFDDGGRFGKDKKRAQKNESKSKRLKNRSGSSPTDTESDGDEHRHHRHSKKHSRKMENDAESSDSAFDGDNLRCEKRPQKSRRKSFDLKKEPKIERNRERIDEEEMHHGHKRIVNHPGISKDDPIRRDEERNASEEVETCLAHPSYEGEAEAELEKACRHAALMKFEEIRKNKDTQAAHSEDSIEYITGKGVVLEKSGSSILETSVASTKRRRI